MMMSFRWGGAEDCESSPQDKLSASDPATASCTFCNPSASDHCASPSASWPILVNPAPGKVKKGQSQRPDLAMKQ